MRPAWPARSHEAALAPLPARPQTAAMRLHYHPLSPYSRKVVIAVEHRGDAIELVQIKLGAGALQKPEYLALNPFGKMPALETSEGPIFESTSIIELLEERGPRKLLPEPLAREARHWDRLGDHYLLSPYATLFWEAGTPAAEGARATVRTAYEVLGKRLARHPFLAGDSFSLGDIGPAIAVDGLAHEGVPVPATLRPWLERVHEVEAMRRSRESAMPFVESTRPMRAIKR